MERLIVAYVMESGMSALELDAYRHAFRSLDTDQSGSVDVDELVAVGR